MIQKRFFHLLLLLFGCGLLLSGAGNKRVLIIGDSISIGYTPYVTKALAGRAQVVHNKGNAGASANGVENLQTWLGNRKWDVIYFNFGLHDLCYRHPDSPVQGHRDKVNGTLTATLEECEQNLETIVTALQQTGAKVIFANTTYVPSQEAGRYAKDVDRYNRVAERVMKRHGIPVDDLHALSLEVHPEFGLGDDNVHYTPEGYRLLSEQVVKSIEKVL